MNQSFLCVIFPHASPNTLASSPVPGQHQTAFRSYTAAEQSLNNHQLGKSELLTVIVLLLLMAYLAFMRRMANSSVGSSAFFTSRKVESGLCFMVLGSLTLIIEFLIFSLTRSFSVFSLVLLFLFPACFVLNRYSDKLKAPWLKISEFIPVFLNLSILLFLLLRLPVFKGSVLPFGLYCLLLVAGLFLHRKPKYYWAFAFAAACTTLALNLFGKLDAQNTLLYFMATFAGGLLNQLRYFVRGVTEKYLLFTNNIVNHGSSLIVASNIQEELVFVSENVKDILGYDRNELHSQNWFKKTIAPEDREDEIRERLREAKKSGKIYSRKMITASGGYKWIQWQYKKFGNDLWVGIGQDITEHKLVHEQYQNIIQSASDIIHKTDPAGSFIFFNKHLEHLLGYNSEELLGKHYTSIVRKDHARRLQTFYDRALESRSPMEIIEFPAIKKSGEEIWLSQSLSVERDTYGKVVSLNSILRDITSAKQVEQAFLNKQLKIELYSKFLRELTFIATSKDLHFDLILSSIIEKTAIGLKTDRISVWFCVNESIQSQVFYDRVEKKLWNQNITIAKQNHPIYFGKLKKGEIIIADDVLTNEATKDFFKDYFSAHDTRSLLDVPVFLDGKLEGILCSESIFKHRVWDTEDVNFVRSVAGLITLAIEANKRKLAEAQLEERSRILSAIGNITEKLLSGENALSILSEHLKFLGEALQCERVYLYRNNPGEQALELNGVWYKNETTQACATHWKEDFLVNEVNNFFNSHTRNVHFSILTKNLQEGELKDLLKTQSVQSLLILPIQLKSRFIGFVGFDESRNERTWTRDSIVLLHSLVSNVVHSLERRSQEQLIQESENNFREINETIRDVFWLYDNLKGEYLYISPSCKDVLGMDQEAFYKGENFGDRFVLEEDLLNYVEALASLKKKEEYEIEYRIRKVDGSVRWIHEKSSAIRNENGELIRNSGICTDVTEQKHIQNQIRQLSLVAEKTSNGVVILDRNGFVLWANQSYLNIMELELDQLLNHRPEDLLVYKPENKSGQSPAVNGTNYSHTFELQTGTGQKKWMEVHNTIIVDEEDHTVQQIQIVSDVTQKRLKDLELAQHRSMLRKYSSFLEYQNELKEKLLQAGTIEEITQVALMFAKENIKNCIHISLLTLDDKKQSMAGYYIFKDKVTRERHSVKSFKSYETIRTGEMFIEPDLLSDGQKSSSDSILIEYGARGYVVLPLMDQKDIIGMVTLTFDAVLDLSESEKENLRNLAFNLSTTIQKLNLKTSLQEKNNDIKDSLKYARNIQKSVLPDLRKDFPSIKNVVLLFEPKDIVSGDFYWAKETNEYIYIALGDCTGHGVPGAFLTLIGTRMLDQIVRDSPNSNSAGILGELDEQLFKALNVSNKSMIRDGMEIALCMVEKSSRRLYFSGVGMGLLVFRQEDEIYIKGQRGSVGDYTFNDLPMEINTLQLTGEEKFYMASDGFQDQLGGEGYKRYSKRRLMDFLLNIQSQDPETQEKLLLDELKEHTKEHFQTDDISLLGFQINFTSHE